MSCRHETTSCLGLRRKYEEDERGVRSIRASSWFDAQDDILNQTMHARGEAEGGWQRGKKALRCVIISFVVPLLHHLPGCNTCLPNIPPPNIGAGYDTMSAPRLAAASSCQFGQVCHETLPDHTVLARHPWVIHHQTTSSLPRQTRNNIHPHSLTPSRTGPIPSRQLHHRDRIDPQNGRDRWSRLDMRTAAPW